MNIVDQQQEFLDKVASLAKVYDNTIEPIKSFPAIVIDVLSEKRMNLCFGTHPDKMKFQVFVCDTTENNEKSISKTRETVAGLISDVAEVLEYNIETEISYTAIKIDGKNAILADFILVV
jgi:hypothetical protein